MTSILSQLKPVTEARLDELLAKLLDGELILVGSKGETAEDVAACFYELRQLRGAAFIVECGSLIGHRPEFKRVLEWLHQSRAAVRPAADTCVSESAGVDRTAALPSPSPEPAALCAPSDKPGHAELAPAADPAPPLGSAVGGPGFKPYED